MLMLGAFPANNFMPWPLKSLCSVRMRGKYKHVQELTSVSEQLWGLQSLGS